MQRRAGNEEVKPALEKIEFLAAFEITEQTPPGQIFVMENWNKMRERLLLLGEMKKN